MDKISRDRAEHLLKGFSTKRVLVVGDVMLDRYVFGRVDRINPEAPTLVLSAESEKDMAGGAGNVAKNAASLGAETVLVAVVGGDEAGRKLGTEALKEGYRAEFIKDLGRPTTEKTRYLVGSHQLLRVDHELVEYMGSEIENALLSAIELQLEEGVDVIIISDYAKGVLSKRVAARILQAGTEGIMVSADVKPRHASLVTGATLVSPNQSEARECIGFRPYQEGKDDYLELAHELSKKMNTEAYITLGASGIAFSTRGSEGVVKQEHRVEVFDVSGAGDTATVILALARSLGATPFEAAQLANAGGAAVVRKIGAVGVTQDEILTLLTEV